MRLVPNASRAIFAAKIASLAVLAPEVFGNSLTPNFFKAGNIASLLLLKSQRLIAMVTSSEPDACTASLKSVELANLPVPVNNLDENSSVRITNLSSVILTSCHLCKNFYIIILMNYRRLLTRFCNDFTVYCHGVGIR